MPEKEAKSGEERKELEKKAALAKKSIEEVEKNISKFLEKTKEVAGEVPVVVPKKLPKENPYKELPKKGRPKERPPKELPEEKKNPKENPPKKEVPRVGNDIGKVETNIDRLHHLIKEKGEIKVSKAAKIFNVNESEIERWGQILQDHNLVQLHYPLIGEAVLKVKQEKQEK